MQDKSEFFDADELDAVTAARETHEERKQTQRAFLDAVSSDSESERLETQTELAEGIVVPLEAKLNGEVIDTLGSVQERLENAEEDGRLYQISDAVDDACQLLADIIADPAYNKEVFHDVYKKEGAADIAKMLRRSFEALQQERERLSGDAEGFRNRT
jgi:hypothetical protein